MIAKRYSAKPVRMSLAVIAIRDLRRDTEVLDGLAVGALGDAPGRVKVEMPNWLGRSKGLTIPPAPEVRTPIWVTRLLSCMMAGKKSPPEKSSSLVSSRMGPV